MKARPKRSIIWKIDKEHLITIVANSQTLTEILRKIGIQGIGGNFVTLKKRLTHDGIGYNHIIMGRNSRKGQKYTGVYKIPSTELFTENSPYDRGAVKGRIIRENLLPYECEACSIGNTWNNKRLVLVLDHKNGINNDHRLDNLRFLCPNCNSQEDTFAGRNRKYSPIERYSPIENYKQVKHCPTCGRAISVNSNKCVECFGKERRTKARNKITKEQLLDDILSMSIVQVGKKYSVSDNAVRKWCKSFDLPCYTKEIQALKESLNKEIITLYK